MAMRSLCWVGDGAGRNRNVRNAHLPGGAAAARDRASVGAGIHAPGGAVAGSLERREIGRIRNSCGTTDLAGGRARALEYALWSERVGRAEPPGCADANSAGNVSRKPSAGLGRGSHGTDEGFARAVRTVGQVIVFGDLPARMQTTKSDRLHHSVIRPVDPVRTLHLKITLAAICLNEQEFIGAW